MAHLQSTMRRIEADEASAPEKSAPELVADALAMETPPSALPGVGTSVRFRLRGGEWRNGANSFAALVIRVDQDKGLVDLVVVLGADDFMDQRNVPRRITEEDYGWEPIEDGALAEVAKLRADLDAFKAELSDVLFGECVRSPLSIYDWLNGIDRRIGLIAKSQTSKAKTKG